MTDMEIIRTIINEFPYALFGSIVAGILCAHLGVFIVSRRVAFFGATLTQVAVMGIAFAHLPLIEINLTIGSTVFTLLVVILIAHLLRSSKIPRDSILGIAFIIAITFRILLIQKSNATEASEIESILKGDILLVTPDQFYLLLAVMIFIMIIHFLFYKQFSFVSFDSETAAAQGYNVKFWEMLLYLTIGFGISIATRIVGDVFVFGFLIIPAVSAILIAKRVNNIIFISILIGIISPIIGLYLAFKFDFPAGPVAVAFAFLILIFTFIIKKLLIFKTH